MSRVIQILSRRLLAGVAALLMLAGAVPAAAAAAAADDTDWIALGRRLYREGIGAHGEPLSAVKAGGVTAQGAAVACIQCHRTSGLGGVEGVNVIPPITGRYLFELDGRAVVQQNIRGVKAFNQRHAPYDTASVALAIRAGRHVSGRTLDELMPRYALDDDSLRALLAYLKPLSSGWSAGVSERRVRLATVITPEVDAARRQVFKDTALAAVRQKNGSVVHGGRSMASAAEMLLRTERAWDHEFWELQGPAETWAAQLAARQAAAPVFALVSGLGEGDWSPVHRFCEQQAMPCWFPSVSAPPPESEADHYSLYFSRGLWLEADVLMQHWQGLPPDARPTRVLQVIGRDSAAAATPVAAMVDEDLAARGIAVERMLLDPADAAGFDALAQRLGRSGPRDAVLLWLRPAALRTLGTRLTTPGGGARLHASGTLLAGAAPALPAPWLAQLRTVYPYQLPSHREASLSVFQQWLQIARLPMVDEVLQSETYFAFTSFNDTLVDMLDNVQRDYLIDRAEAMLTQREKSRAEDEAREAAIVTVNRGPRASAHRPVPERRIATRPMPGRLLRADAPTQDTVAAIERAESTTVYPRLSLAAGQRHASKGAYLVRHAADAAIEADSAWIVP
ncbi:hypothetical protein [Leptothrix discophora]|uniref:Cytochrome c domain-containing protein n=1 Tax=Leptothrix discophora TaxID=89 RepID=A0ABT9G7T4_LEPDI|nr:hypothetical protein [Leptothrix discophora]MDP4302525.1 hypothetical protein [Leptothrix discophora]